MNSRLLLGGSLILILRLILFLLSFADYGYFLDEYYYLSCSFRPDLGYVDHPPLSIWILRMQVETFGDSLLSIRTVPFLAAEISIVIAGIIAHRLGGNDSSILFSMLSVALCPVLLGLTKFYSMNSLDLLLWGSAILYFIACLQKPELKNWSILGILLGLGLINKYGILMPGAGFFLGLLFSRFRRLLLRPGPYLTGFIACLIFLPHLYWQYSHEWPTLEFMQNATLHKNYFQPLSFLGGLILEWNPLLMPVWLGGLLCLLLPAQRLLEQKPEQANLWKSLGWVSLTVFFISILGKGKSYYIAPLVVLLIPAGSVVLFSSLERIRSHSFFSIRMVRLLSFSVVLISGAMLAPLSLPLLSAGDYVRYEKFLGLQPPKFENHNRGTMPQHFAGMFGWDNLQSEVHRIYRKLPERQQTETVIIARNYGLAGALDYQSRMGKLPPVGSPHNNFHLWGIPRAASGQPKHYLFIGFSAQELQPYFAVIEQEAMIHCEQCMEYRRDTEIILASQPRKNPTEIWSKLKFFI